MTRDRRRASLLALTAATAVGALGAGTLATSGPPSSPLVLSASGSTAAGKPGTAPSSTSTGCAPQGRCAGLPKSFEVSVGRVTGLYPGSVTDVPVSYTNPNSFAIRVTDATLSGKGPASCPASFLRTGQHRPGVVVPRQATVETRLPFGMLATAPDGCKGASFAVTVTASAVRQ